MPIEYVPVFDEDGNDVGGYTESVPDTYVKEEPDCFDCNDAGCPACDGSQIGTAPRISPDEALSAPMGSWGGYSDFPPF
jgi:hypothetical protein